jgi:transposase-like protein
VAEQLESGLTVAEFAVRRRLNANTLSWWRTQLRREGPVGFAAVAVSPGRAASVHLEVELPSGLRLGLEVPAERATLDAVLAALSAVR